MLNPLWACDLANCPYCWLSLAKVERIAPLHSADEWLKALQTLPPIGKIDVCGGEPTIWPELHAFCQQSSRPWAITSNLYGEGFMEFVTRPLGNCLCWTCTYHPSSGMSRDKFAAKAEALFSTGFYPVVIAIMEVAEAALQHLAWFLDHGFPTALEPFEPIPSAKGDVTFRCKGGQNFLFLAPDGEAYPCVDSFRAKDRKARSLGNIFQNTLKLPTVWECDLTCSTFLTLIPRHPGGDCHNLQPKPAK